MALTTRRGGVVAQSVRVGRLSPINICPDCFFEELFRGFFLALMSADVTDTAECPRIIRGPREVANA